MPRKVNPFGKTRKVDNPYAEYTQTVGRWKFTYRVLKTRKHPDNEKSQYDIWFVAGKSENTFGSWEYGDMYKDSILGKTLRGGSVILVDCEDEWAKYYG